MTKDANPKTWTTLVADGGRLYSDPANAPGEPASWQLATGHFLPAHMPLNIIHPRPAAETNAYAVSRLWPSQTPWVIPIAAQGGAWPFKYEIVSDGGMSGLTIGETLDYATWNSTFRLGEYGVLRCNSPAIGEYTIVVRVTDQEGTEEEVTIQVDIVDREDTTRFFWMNRATGSDSNNGSYSSPFLTHAAWYGVDQLDATSQNRQIHYMAGTYPMSEAELIDGCKLECRVTKAQVHNAVEGQEVIFDGEDTAYLRFTATSLGDCAVIGIKFINLRSDEFDGLVADKGMAINFQGPSAEDRAVVFRCKFDGSTVGDVGSNTSCVFWGDATADDGEYSVLSQCEYIDLNNIMHALLYSVQDFVIEGNYSTGSHIGGPDPDTARGFFVKGVTASRITIRANDHFDQPTPFFHYSEFTQDRKEDIEVVWNRAYCPTATDIGLGVAQIGPGGAAPTTDYGSFWMSRNSFRTNRILIQNLGTGPTNGPFTFENNAIQCGASYVAGGGFDQSVIGDAIISITGTECVASSGVFDSNLNLTGAYAAYKGTRGAEIA